MTDKRSVDATVDNTKVDIMTDFDPTRRQISGPDNVARLEGEIHGIKKTVYLFMDIHMDVHNQTECTSIFKRDVDEYFADTFYKLNKSDKTFDFFLEIRPSEELYNPNEKANPMKIDASLYKEKYIEQVMKLFKKMFKYDESKNKVSVSEIFNNVRLHYLDVRDYFYFHIYLLIDQLMTKQQFLQHGLPNRVLEQMIGDLVVLRDKMKELIVVFKNTQTYPENKKKIPKQKDSNVFDLEAAQQLIYKMKNRYNYEDVQKILNELLTEFVKELDSYLEFLEKTINDFQEYKNFMIDTMNVLTRDERRYDFYSQGPSTYDIATIKKLINDRLDRLSDEIVGIFAKITDIYLLRRLLDKDYVTNIIIYSGEYHSADYIYILVKYFGFKITHIAYSAIESLDELNEAIIKTPFKEIGRILYKPKIYQCSDITNFPENFD